MAISQFGIASNEIPVDANEAIKAIQDNKTLMIVQLTDDEPVQPESVAGLKTVEDVFRRFQPAVNVEMEDKDGLLTYENLKFSHLGDFKPESIVNQSPMLNNLKTRQEQFTKINRQLKSNKMLQYLLADSDRKESILDAIRIMVEELQHAGE